MRLTQLDAERLNEAAGIVADMVRDDYSKGLMSPAAEAEKYIKRLEASKIINFRTDKKRINKLTLIKILGAVIGDLMLVYKHHGFKKNSSLVKIINDKLQFEAVKITPDYHVVMTARLFQELEKHYTGAVIVQDHNRVEFERLFKLVHYYNLVHPYEINFKFSDTRTKWFMIFDDNDIDDGFGWYWGVYHENEHLEKRKVNTLHKAKSDLLDFVWKKIK